MSHLDELLSEAAQRAVDAALRQLLTRPEYIDTRQAAAHLGVSTKQMEKWRITGGGPPYSKMARAVRYRRSDLDAFMAERRVSSTREEGPKQEGVGTNE